jgi:hypothetical protein
MKCPYCEKEMKNGILFGDGRAKVRWQPKEEKIGLLDKMVTEKGCVDAQYTLARFEIICDYCDSCNKIIIDTKVSE